MLSHIGFYETWPHDIHVHTKLISLTGKRVATPILLKPIDYGADFVIHSGRISWVDTAQPLVALVSTVESFLGRSILSAFP
jgi:hypothetical protein